MMALFNKNFLWSKLCKPNWNNFQTTDNVPVVIWLGLHLTSCFHTRRQIYRAKLKVSCTIGGVYLSFFVQIQLYSIIIKIFSKSSVLFCHIAFTHNNMIYYVDYRVHHSAHNWYKNSIQIYLYYASVAWWL